MTADDAGTSRHADARKSEDSVAARTVTELTPESTGRWVLTSRGSRHLIDLDERTYERRPGPTSSTFPYDRTPLQLLRIEVWPKVGGRMLVWLHDPVHAHLEHWRVSSTIRNITRHGDPS